MSQLLPGLRWPAPPPPAEPLVAAAVILWRPGPRGRELYWVRRGALRFAGGFQAFPGGRLDPADARLPVPGAAGPEAALLACAARELFEETGVLLAAGPPPPRDALRAGRRALLDGGVDFAAFLARHALEVDASRLAAAGRWITPAWMPLRYDAHLFLARARPEDEAEVWPGELDAGEWIAAADAEARWERGEALLHPPNLWGVQCLAREEPPACLERLRAPPATEGFVTRRVEFQRGLFLAPVRTPTIPPATHTNVWIPALPGGALAAVDPGSPDPEEQAKLEAVLGDLAADGLTLREIWLTHAHPDHVGGAAALRAAHPGAVLRAHPDAAARLPGGLGPVVPLADGDLLGGRWRALHTPGHALGHVAFLDEATGALLAGDLASTLSTIVIDPPEGDMAEYLRSLARVRDLAPRSLYPAHGAATQGAAAKLDALLAHRREREAKVAAALAALGGPGTLEEITARAYDDTPAEAHPIAARSCLASLEKLSREGRASLVAGRWRGETSAGR